MADRPSENGSTPDASALAPGPDPAPAVRDRRRFGAIRRWTRRLLAVAAAAIAALVVTSITIDLGRFPAIREQAERRASEYLQRPMHIGSVHALLWPGTFALDDVLIEGTPESRPFFRAKRIKVSVSWRTLLRRELVVNVELDEWRMAFETWPGGRSNKPPGLKGRPQRAGGRKIFNKTTVSYVHARRGEFVFDDHGLPWSVVARNLDFSMTPWRGDYVGTARFHGGTVRIQNYLPMAAALSTRFTLSGGKVNLHHIDLVTDGATSHVTGVLDFSTWPEQTYNVRSDIDFSRMREIFFARETWRATGKGEFTGVFRIFREGKALIGGFKSDRTTVAGIPFSGLHGTLEWVGNRFAVTHADAGLFGGRTNFAYAAEPLGAPGGATHRFVADYDDINLDALHPRVSLKGIRLNGTAHGHLTLAWPSNRFGTHREGRGETIITPPPNVVLAAAALPPGLGPVAPDKKAFTPLADPIALGGTLQYHFGADGLAFEPSWVATPTTHIAFEGRTNDHDSNLPFHVTSTSWQSSARLLSTIMTALTGPTRAVEVNGYGTFDGVMRSTFRAPRIEGRFAGDEMHVWNVNWGRATGDIVLENKYVQIANGIIGKPDGRTLHANGRFSLGYRTDGADEMDATVKLINWPMADLKTAFELADWPVDGTIALADLKLRGPYRRPVGSGPLRIERGVAWKEAFDSTEGRLEFVPTGVHLQQMRLIKGTGTVRGSAFIGWDETYGFSATGQIPVESLDNFRNERAQLSGLLDFRATGASRIDNPKYDISGTVESMFIADRGIGYVSGRMSISDNVLQITQLDVTSFLQVSCSGRIALDDTYDAVLSFNVTNSSVHEYLSLFEFGKKISGYTKLLVSGRGSIRGPLADPAKLAGSVTIQEASLTILDYELKNNGNIALALDGRTLTIRDGQNPAVPGALKLTGEGTDLALSGSVSLAEETINLEARGEAALKILQTADVRGDGRAELVAQARGPFADPVLTGYANITDGKLRYASLAHSLTAITGRVNFNERSIELLDVRSQFAEGELEFDGEILLDQFVPSELNLEAHTIRPVELRYPANFRSTLNADLSLTGPVTSPLLSGQVNVVRVTSLPQTGLDVGILGVAAGGVAGAAALPRGAPAGESGFPLRYNIGITAPARTLVFENAAVGARLEGSGDLTVTGTYDRPVLLGTVEIDNGVVNFNGNRIVVTRGAIDFYDPTRIEPYFDIQAEARARPLAFRSSTQGQVDPSQTFHVNLGISGTFDRIDLTATSDPWLSEYDIITLLLGATPDVGRTEQRALGSTQQAQAQVIQTAAAQILASPISAQVGNVVQRTIPGSSISIAPVLSSSIANDQLSPAAKLVYSQRVSERLFLTYTTTHRLQEDIILLEYEQNERVSWVLSRNEDRSFALDFRLRYVF
jgi:hypothetical protein